MKQILHLFVIISITAFICSCSIPPNCDIFIGDWENIHPNGGDATTSLNIKKDGEVYLITVLGYHDGTDYGIKLLSENISASCLNGELEVNGNINYDGNKISYGSNSGHIFIGKSEFQKKMELSENNLTTTSLSNSTPSEKKVSFNQSDANARKILQGKWYGTIGKKNFSLNLEAVGGGKLSGYDVAGANKRPVSGSYSFNEEGWACSITLKEPGDDKWDGIFNLDFEVYSDNWSGTGTWKSFNGQLSNPVSLSKRATDNPDDFVSPANSSNEGDKFIGVWITSKNDEVKISKADKNYKVAFHPDEDEIFDFIGIFHNGKIKCPLGQNNRDTITFSLVGNKLKFFGEWDGAFPGPETYIFNRK